MDVGESIGMALRFLLSAQVRGGLWWDFYIPVGASDEWVTAYVGGVLAVVPDDEARQTARLAWRRLQGSHWWSPGWGYNAYLPADSDSTAWALRLAEALGVNTSGRAKRAYRFLARHLRQDGGIVTFADDRGLRLFTPYSRSTSFDGWCGQHPCASAAVAGLTQLQTAQAIRQYLRSQQAADGGWNGYWWPDREYTTALAVEALTKSDRPGDSDRIAEAARWASGRLSPDGCIVTPLYPDGSPFATALAAQILILCGDPAHDASLDCAVGWLLSHQHAGGYWQPSAAMRLPHPSLQDPDSYQRWVVQRGGSDGTIAIDERAIFTTATVLKTLCRLAAKTGVN